MLTIAAFLLDFTEEGEAKKKFNFGKGMVMKNMALYSEDELDMLQQFMLDDLRKAIRDNLFNKHHLLARLVSDPDILEAAHEGDIKKFIDSVKAWQIKDGAEPVYFIDLDQ